MGRSLKDLSTIQFKLPLLQRFQKREHTLFQNGLDFKRKIQRILNLERGYKGQFAWIQKNTKMEAILEEGVYYDCFLLEISSRTLVLRRRQSTWSPLWKALCLCVMRTIISAVLATQQRDYHGSEMWTVVSTDVDIFSSMLK